MNKIMKIFIICFVFAIMSSCKNHALSIYDEQSSDESKAKKIEFSEFTVNIKNKDNSGNWSDLGDLVVRKEEDGIETGLNVGKGYTATFFTLEESEVNNFVKAMTEGGAFKASLYYGYKNEQNVTSGIQNKEIITKIEKINNSEYITFLGDKIKDSGDKVAEYAILLEDLKKI
ncbi:borrelia outer surface E family protein (plasmid) [Borreliella bissettiae DN127]|uniref:Borrelia outer surface E family protein n=1 Tax=Borrelia bissettiae (strain DSM 17990 / CIP 109136 / DN127) TaxID=521010 RepID=G0AN83_BORBD|nr:Erp family outer-surface lipoprotein [Borreliella bissettiae]AEL19159.1 borrelia outer surface E family protein [Borreliella bissettiae DN127]